MSKEKEIVTATTVIVARHGERLDYYLRDYKNANFLSLPSTKRPWDPPLTNRGRLHGRKLGEKIRYVVNDLNRDTEQGDINLDGTKIAQLGFVYSSPMMRCVQTASEAIIGYKGEDSVQQPRCNHEGLTVRIEPGLMESMNEKWFRSWCLSDSNGTWGGPKGHTYIDGHFPPPAKNISNVKDSARHPCVRLLSTGKEIQQNIIALGNLERADGWIDDSISKTEKEDYSMNDNSELVQYVTTEAENVYRQEPQYCWENFESRSQVDVRVETTVELLADKHPNQTILLLSHGSPCTKIYSRLTGDESETHGVSTYASFSIYQRTSAGKGKWRALLLNNSSHVKELEEKLGKIDSST